MNGKTNIFSITDRRKKHDAVFSSAKDYYHADVHFITTFVSMKYKFTFRSDLIFLVAFILQFLQFSFAQNFKAGAFAGISASQVSGDNLGGFNKAGLYAGG